MELPNKCFFKILSYIQNYHLQPSVCDKFDIKNNYLIGKDFEDEI